jgi:hypothetical protein
MQNTVKKMGADRGNGRRQQYLYDLYLFFGIHSEKRFKRHRTMPPNGHRKAAVSRMKGLYL